MICHRRLSILCVCVCACARALSHTQLFMTLWAVTHQAPQSMGFSRQEYWSGLPCPSPEDLPDPEIEPVSLASPALAGGFFTWEAKVALVVKNPAASAGDIRDMGSIPGSGRYPVGGHDNPLQYSWPGESHGERSLVGYSPGDHKELDTTEAPEHSTHAEYSSLCYPVGPCCFSVLYIIVCVC